MAVRPYLRTVCRFYLIPILSSRNDDLKEPD